MFDIAFLHEGTDAARLELGCLEYMMDQVLWGIEAIQVQDNSHPKRRGWNAEPGSQGEHIKAGFGPVIIADGWAQLGNSTRSRLPRRLKLTPHGNTKNSTRKSGVQKSKCQTQFMIHF